MHLTHVVAMVCVTNVRIVMALIRRRGILHHVSVGHVSVRWHLVHVAVGCRGGGGRLLGDRHRGGGCVVSHCSARRWRSRFGCGLQHRIAAHGELVLGRLGERLCLATRSVLVVGMFLHVDRAQSLGFIDERSFLRLGQILPLGAQSLRDLGIVHLGIVRGHLSALAARPHHKGIHGSLDAIQVLVLATRVIVVVDRGG